MASSINLFIQAAPKFKQAPEELRSMIIHNIDALASNALTTTFVDLSSLNDVKMLALDLTTLKFSPKEEGIFSLFKSLFSQTSEDAENIPHFIDFLCCSFSDLVKKEARSTLTIAEYILQSYRKVDYGLAYLSEHYRLQKMDDKAKNSIKKAVTCWNALLAACNLVTGKKNWEIKSFDIYKETFFKYERYAPLRKLNAINADPWTPAIQKKIKNFHDEFYAGCLHLSEEELKQLCSQLIDKDGKINSTDSILSTLLKNPHFSASHDTFARELLRKQNLLENDKEFQERMQSEPVRAALDHFKQGIKKHKNTLGSYLATYKNFQDYPPFSSIISFVYGKNSYFPKSAYHDKDSFIKRVLMDIEDVDTLDINSPEGKMVLLNAAKFMFDNRTNTKCYDREKMEKWVELYPEARNIPKINSVIVSILGTSLEQTPQV